jgi:Ca-activated chloride channel family protein
MFRWVAGRRLSPGTVFRLGLLLGAVCLAVLALFCEPAPAAPGDVELLFTYGSEKQNWLTDVTAAFNKANIPTLSGKRIQVTAVPMGSGESMEEVLSERRKAHLISPASGAFIELGNADARAKGANVLIDPTKTKNLVLSPVVIAMWKPMAESLGWPSKPVGWGEVLELAKHQEGWKALKPEYEVWGKLKFGHTHPELSNSGLISVLAEVYAGAKKVQGLTEDDVKRPEVGKFLEDIERSMVHYGHSTGFFGKKMFEEGPGYLSAAVLYENMVIESYSLKNPTDFPLVAIYPREGTFWSDHPVGIVERPWVTKDHRDAANIYIDYLRAKPQQLKAMTYGFRPGDEGIDLVAPIDAKHGVDPNEPKQVLPVPTAPVMRSIIELWKERKKHIRLVLVVDTSGSMRMDQKLTNAQAGAGELIDMLGDRDTMCLLSFNNKPAWVFEKEVAMNPDGKKLAKQKIGLLFPMGETALYDSIALAEQHIANNPQPDMISVVVVLTDGEDNKSKLEKVEDLLPKIKYDPEKLPTRIFTIAYGMDANKDVLKKVSDASKAKSYEGTPENIKKVFKTIVSEL